jgi:hypothetical protein
MPSAGATAEHANPRPLSRRSENDQAELDKMDAAVERMKKHTRPDPYLVTIDRDPKLQYEHQWKSQQWQWLRGTAFRPEEGEGIQYQTFVYQDPGTDNLLSLHAQYYPEERPGTADSTRNATGSHTPAQGPKKVISFGAYKKKQNGETPTRESQAVRDSDKSGKQPAVKGPAERVKTQEAESADMLKAAEEDERADANRGTQKSKEPSRPEQASSKSPELKRKRVGEPDTANKAPETNGHEPARPIKKVKTDAPAPAVKDTKKARTPSPAPEKRPANKNKDDAEANLPPKLSPLHDVPPKLSPLRNELHMRSPSRDVPPKLSPLHDAPQTPEAWEMPPRISPDLPDNISASLRMADGDNITVSRTSKKRGEERSEGMNGGVAGKGKSTEQNSSQRARSKSPERGAAEQSSLHASTEDAVDEAPADAQELPDGKKRNSLVAKIKFKKARKEDVQRILKLPARPDKRMTSTPSPMSSDEEDTVEPAPTQKASSSSTSKTADKTDQERRSGKGVAQKTGPASKKAEDKRPVAEKRPRAEPTADPTENPEPSAKRKKVDDAVPEPPSKKRQPDVAASQTVSKKKAPGALDLKKAPSTPMPPAVPSPAVSSVQKSQLMTPVGRKDHLHPKRDASADSQVDTPSGHSNTPSDHTRTSQPNGTSSKQPSSNPHPTKAPTAQAWADEQKRLEKVGRDLKHAASDLLNNKPNATSRRTGAAKSLESLFCYLLAFTCSDRAALAENKNIPMRSWRSLPPFGSFVAKATQDFAALNGLHSSLSVVIHMHILDIAARYPNEGPSRESIIDLSGALHKAAMAADENLDIDTLMTTFPKTWAGRSKSVVVESGGEPKKLLQAGGYKLPLGVQTDALQATRAGLAMLKEWLAKEGVEYEFKLVG